MSEGSEDERSESSGDSFCRVVQEFLEGALDRLGDGVPVLQPTKPDAGSPARLRDRLDAGEADALLAASERDGAIATEDLAARRIASEREVPVTGSVGILVPGVRRDVVDLDVAEDWLATWRDLRGYHAPVERVDDVLERRRGRR